MSMAAMDRRQALRMFAALFGSALAAQFTLHGSAASCPAWADSEFASALKALDLRDLQPADTEVLDVWSRIERGDESTLRRLVSADYESGRVLEVGGWWVSNTEARMLVALRARC